MSANDRSGRTTRILIRLITASVCIVSLSASDAKPRDLIQNGSFELDGGDFGPLRSEWDDGVGQGNDIGFAVRDYPFCEAGQGCESSAGGGFELPPGIVDSHFSGVVAPLDGGRFYGNSWGVWSGNGMRGSATQIVDLSGHSSKPYSFSAWLASRVLDTDYAIVSLEFFEAPDGEGASFGAILFDGDDQTSPFITGSLSLVGLADATIPATQDNWTLYQASGTIPTAAVSAAVVIRGGGITGGGNNGYVDLVSLQVIPEPASLVLLLTGIGVGLLYWRGMRGLR